MASELVLPPYPGTSSTGPGRSWAGYPAGWPAALLRTTMLTTATTTMTASSAATPAAKIRRRGESRPSQPITQTLLPQPDICRIGWFLAGA